MHLVLVDNGRSTHLGKKDFYQSLKCIRCGACINTCPVYRRSGGHSYHHTISGPIGAILAPNLDPQKNADLPFASTLCGSCTNVCPVKIDLHNQLYLWRQVLAQDGQVPKAKAVSMQAMATVLANPKVYRLAGKSGRFMLRWLPGVAQNKRFNAWARQREMPSPPKESFRDWYLKNRKTK